MGTLVHLSWLDIKFKQTNIGFALFGAEVKFQARNMYKSKQQSKTKRVRTHGENKGGKGDNQGWVGVRSHPPLPGFVLEGQYSWCTTLPNFFLPFLPNLAGTSQGLTAEPKQSKRRNKNKTRNQNEKRNGQLKQVQSLGLLLYRPKVCRYISVRDTP